VGILPGSRAAAGTVVGVEVPLSVAGRLVGWAARTC
jgi:hypothetical protein